MTTAPPVAGLAAELRQRTAGLQRRFGCGPARAPPQPSPFPPPNPAPALLTRPGGRRGGGGEARRGFASRWAALAPAARRELYDYARDLVCKEAVMTVGEDGTVRGARQGAGAGAARTVLTRGLPNLVRRRTS